MTILDIITNTQERIEREREKLIYLALRSITPQGGGFSGIPNDTHNTSNPIEDNLIKKEETEKRINNLLALLEKQWKRAARKMRESNIDEQTQKMIYYRFYKCMKWKDCASKLDKKYPNCKWNENKCFRKYREVLWKIGQ